MSAIVMTVGAMSNLAEWAKREYLVEDAEQAFDLLYAENMRALNYCYRTSLSACGVKYAPTAWMRVSPAVWVYKTCLCWRASVDDLPDVEETEAWQISTRIIERAALAAISAMPDYDKVPWGGGI